VKYYEGHEQAYQKLKADGQSTWDRREYDAFYMRPFLEQALKNISFASAAPKVLELGCGTGPISCFLAAQGFDVTGIDVSSTAIEMARAESARRNLSVRFEIQDWLSLPQDDMSYDLVIDGHCLHCIVFDDERAKGLNIVHSLLRPGGKFIVETMVCKPTMRFGDNFIYDSGGFLWVRVSENYSHEKKRINDGWYVPNRRILTPEAQETELLNAGFRITFINIAEQAPDEPAELQAVCEK